LTKNSAPEELDEKLNIVAPQINCSNCSQLIKGVRYKCFVCRNPDVNFCATCEALPDIHDSLHAWIKISTPQQCPDTGIIATRLSNEQMLLVGTVGLPYGSCVNPNESFFAGWRLRNSRSTAWDEGMTLQWVGGDKIEYHQQEVEYKVPPIKPGEEFELLVELVAPKVRGTFKGLWRVMKKDETLIGPPLPFEIAVDGAPVVSPTDNKAHAKKPKSKPPPPPVVPPSGKPKSPSMYETELEQLARMGFTDRAVNLKYLAQGKKVQEIVDTLLG